MEEERKNHPHYTTYTFSLDEEVATKAREVLHEQGLTLEDALVMFFDWVVSKPEEAKKEILRWVEEEKKNNCL
jgi:antitoxin component of RelBE/YafQ-DinJ toxin-antitoxin module